MVQMGIEINLSNLNISGEAEILNNAKINNSDDVHIELKSLDVSGRAKLLENIEINPLLEKLEQKAQFMDKNSEEYLEIEKILNRKRWDKDSFTGCLIKHIGEFSQGVLASIVANLIT